MQRHSGLGPGDYILMWWLVRLEGNLQNHQIFLNHIPNTNETVQRLLDANLKKDRSDNPTIWPPHQYQVSLVNYTKIVCYINQSVFLSGCRQEFICCLICLYIFLILLFFIYVCVFFLSTHQNIQSISRVVIQTVSHSTVPLWKIIWRP